MYINSRTFNLKSEEYGLKFWNWNLLRLSHKQMKKNSGLDGPINLLQPASQKSFSSCMKFIHRREGFFFYAGNILMALGNDSYADIQELG